MKPTTKFFAHLAPTEAAAVAVALLDDPAAFAQIAASHQRAHAFRFALGALLLAAQTFGASHWRLRFEREQVVVVFATAEAAGDTELALAAVHRIRSFDAMLIAADDALDAFGVTHGVAPDALRQLAYVERHQPADGDTVPCAEYRTAMTAALNGCATPASPRCAVFHA